jgi:hypothetical protein
MSTALQIMNLALKQSGVLKFGQTAGADLLNDALEVLNQLLSEWSNTRLLVPCVTWGSFTLVVGDDEYTVGASGAQVTATRPEDIDRAFIRSGGIDYPVRIIDEESFMNISIKTTSARPSVLWYNPTVPNGTINLYPTPSSADTFYYSHVQNFTQMATNASTLIVPAGYDSALMWNLSVRLASMLGRPMDPIIVDNAQKSVSTLLALNAVRRAKPAVLDILTAYPAEGGGDAWGGGETIEGLLIE